MKPRAKQEPLSDEAIRELAAEAVRLGVASVQDLERFVSSSTKRRIINEAAQFDALDGDRLVEDEVAVMEALLADLLETTEAEP